MTTRVRVHGEEEEGPTVRRESCADALFVDNLSVDMTKDEIYNLFSEFGPIDRADVPLDHQVFW